MISRSVAFGLVAAACVVAAGGGAYIATLQHERHDSAMAASPRANAQAPAQAPAIQAPAADPATALPTEQLPSPPPSAAPPLQPSPDDVVTPPKAKVAEKGSARTRSERASRLPADRPRAGDESSAPRAPQAQAVPMPPQQVPTPVPAPSDAPDREQPQVQPEPERAWEELTVPRESVIGLQLETPLSSETARIEDRVDARVTREVRVDGRVAIPVGAHAIGTVTLVDRGGKIRERARLGVRFNTLILADGSRMSLTTDTVLREGDAPSTQSSAKIGGAAIGGAIIGAILGGGKGAAIGSGIGAAGGTAAAMAGDRHPVVLPVGTPVSVRIQAPLTVTVEK